MRDAAAKALDPANKFLRRVTSGADLSTDEGLLEVMGRIAPYNLPEADDFIMAHLDAVRRLLDRDDTRTTALRVLVIVTQHKQAETGTRKHANSWEPLMELLTPHMEELAGMGGTFLYSFIGDNPVRRAKALELVVPRWRASMKVPLTGDGIHCAHALCSEYEDERSIARAIVMEAMPGTGVERLFPFWTKAYHTYFNLLRVMELERDRPGSTRVLHDEFGIAHFGRYPLALLIEQFDTRDTDVPYGLLAAGYEDHNGAFESTHENLGRFRRSEPAKGHVLRIVEFGSRPQIARQILALRRRYEQRGSKERGHKASYGILDDHGREYFTHSGLHAYLIGVSGKAFAGVFEHNAWVSLLSCSTGKADAGIAARLSQHNLRVIAPPRDAAIQSLTALPDPQTGVRPEPVFVDGDTNEIIPYEIFIDGKRQKAA